MTLNFSIIYILLSQIAVVTSLVFYIRLYLRLDLSKSIKALHKTTEGNWKLNLTNQEINASLISSSFVSNKLIILNFTGDNTGVNYSTLVLSDSIDLEQFRKLKVFIKTQSWQM